MRRIFTGRLPSTIIMFLGSRISMMVIGITPAASANMTLFQFAPSGLSDICNGWVLRIL